MLSSPASTDLIVRKAPLPMTTFVGICEDYIPQAIAQTKALARKFNAHAGSTTEDICRTIWAWCRVEFNYQEDRLGYEEIRLPRRSWQDRERGIDCEDFVILVSGILHHLEINHTVRMTDYGNGWQHIYLKVGKVTLDPVNPIFNQEPAFVQKKDCHIDVKTDQKSYPLPKKYGDLSGLGKGKWDFVDEITNGLRKNQIYNRVSLQNTAKAAYGIENREVVKELTELAYFKHAAHVVDVAPSAEQAYESLVQHYRTQANSSLRTSESILLQQYSTHLPMSYLIGHFCGIDKPMRTVFEPTAGNGFLLVAAGGRSLRGSWVNEVSENRYDNLIRLARDYKFTVTKNDATDPAFYAGVPTFPVVLANPPFGLMERRKFDKIVTKKIDHWIILNALTRMQDDGRAAFLLGGHPHYDAEGRIAPRDKSTGDRYFFNYLYHHYHVADLINVNGELYSRQGTQFDVRIILIDGRKKTPEGYAPLRDNTNETIAQTWEQLWSRVSVHFSGKDKWADYIKKHFSVGQKVWVVENDSKNYLKPRSAKYALATIQSLQAEKPDSIQVHIPFGEAVINTHVDVSKVYFENPAENPNTPSVLELYPIDAAVTPENSITEAEKLIKNGIGLSKSANYTPKQWANIKKVMNWLVDNTPYVFGYNYDTEVTEYALQEPYTKHYNRRGMTALLAELYVAKRPVSVQGANAELKKDDLQKDVSLTEWDNDKKNDNGTAMKATIKHNTLQNGIEIKFAGDPGPTVISWLKSNGYRWARKGHWYVIYSESRWKTINAKFGEGSESSPAESASVPTPVPVQSKSPDRSAAEKLVEFQNRHEAQKDYYELSYPDFRAKVRSLRPAYFTVNGIRIEMEYRDGTIAGSHLPKGRKRPDFYSLSSIYDMLQNRWLQAGGILPFETLSSNEKNKSRFLYTRDLDYFVKVYPQQANALDYKEWASEAEKRTEIKQREIDKWNRYRLKYLKEKTTVYVLNLRAKSGDKMFLKGVVESSIQTEMSSNRYDTVQVAVPMGIIWELGNRLLKDVYFENPDENPEAKSVLELHPIDDAEKPQDDKAEVEKYIGIGFDKSADYQPEAWAKAKRIMDWLVANTPYVIAYDYGYGKGKYTLDDFYQDHYKFAEMKAMLAELYAEKRPVSVHEAKAKLIKPSPTGNNEKQDGDNSLEAREKKMKLMRMKAKAIILKLKLLNLS